LTRHLLWYSCHGLSPVLVTADFVCLMANILRIGVDYDN
jgi:hypothetical protein